MACAQRKCFQPCCWERQDSEDSDVTFIVKVLYFYFSLQPLLSSADD